MYSFSVSSVNSSKAKYQKFKKDNAEAKYQNKVGKKPQKLNVDPNSSFIICASFYHFIYRWPLDKSLLYCFCVKKVNKIVYKT